jgi:hypothetical protein
MWITAVDAAGALSRWIHHIDEANYSMQLFAAFSEIKHSVAGLQREFVVSRQQLALCHLHVR